MTREEAAIDYCLFIGNTSLDEVDAFKAGAEWEHKRLVEKACEWLRRNYTNYMINDLSKYVEDVCSFDIFDDSLVDDFRKTMEE